MKKNIDIYIYYKIIKLYFIKILYKQTKLYTIAI